MSDRMEEFMAAAAARSARLDALDPEDMTPDEWAEDLTPRDLTVELRALAAGNTLRRNRADRTAIYAAAARCIETFIHENR